MARGPTRLQQQYKREQAKLKRRVRTAEKRGFIFGSNIIPEMPGRVTQKSLQNIQSLRGDTLYAQAQAFIDPISGEAFDPEGIGHALRQKAAMKGVETRKRKQREPKGGRLILTSELDAIFEKLWNWVYTVQVGGYTGQGPYRRRRNDHWEKLWDAQETGVKRIREIIDRTNKAYMDEYDRQHPWKDLEEAQGYAQRQIAKNILQSGVDLDEATRGIQYSSQVEQVNYYVNQIVAAVTGRPLTMNERKDLAGLLLTDGTDYTDEDEYPI